MKRVLLASPWRRNAKCDEQDHQDYARECLADSLRRNEAPFASHLLYPQILDERVEEDRQLGMAAGLSWLTVCQLLVVYRDLGISPGMEAEILSAKNAGIPVEYRQLD